VKGRTYVTISKCNCGMSLLRQMWVVFISFNGAKVSVARLGSKNKCRDK
jgi:hypothetical protein